MAYITMNAFVDGLEALVVSGVVRSYTHGPPSGAAGVGDCPAMFVHLPAMTGAPLVFGEGGGNGTLSAQVIILVEPVAQSRNPENFDAGVDMMDALEDALRGAECAIGKIASWNIRLTELEVAGIAYWAVIAQIEAGRWA